MSILDKICGKMGLMDADDEEILDEDEDKDKDKAKDKFGDKTDKEMDKVRDNDMDFTGGRTEPLHNVVDFHSHGSKTADQIVASYKMKVIVIEPKSFDDAQQVANCLREKRPVVVNFEKTEREVAKRILDFISGTTYALSAEISKVGNNVFLCAPNNVNVAFNEENRQGTAEMPWLGKR